MTGRLGNATLVMKQVWGDSCSIRRHPFGCWVVWKYWSQEVNQAPSMIVEHSGGAMEAMEAMDIHQPVCKSAFSVCNYFLVLPQLRLPDEYQICFLPRHNKMNLIFSFFKEQGNVPNVLFPLPPPSLSPPSLLHLHFFFYLCFFPPLSCFF